MKLTRWLTARFSLRTLFVVVTLCGMWMGWQFQLVQTRKHALKQLGDSGAVVRQHQAWGKPSRISWLREFMGDTSVFSIALPHPNTEDDVERLGELFPEAEISLPGTFGGAF